MVKVELAVYDLSRGMAMALSQQILGQRIDGIWHTGIVVNNIEYYFGGGIQQSPYGAFAQQSQLPCLRLENMGETTKTSDEIHAFLYSIRHQFSIATYDLINNNCNNFSNALCNFLTGHGIPTYIVDLPRIAFSTPGGQMLRPLIESMQNGIQQQRGSMDPFGGYSAQQQQPSIPSASPSAFTSTLATNVQTTVSNLSISSSLIRAGPPPAATIDDKPLISNDRSSVAALGNKLMNLAGADGQKGSLLQPAEKELLQSIVDNLTTVTVNNDAAPFNAESFRLLANLIATQPTAQMSCLFLLRLMVLHDNSLDHDQVGHTVAIILDKLADNQGGFVSSSVKVMAICTLANILSHSRGQDILLSDDSLVSQLVDVSVTNMAHDRPEMRQMACALANNMAISLVKNTAVEANGSATEMEIEAASDAVELSPTAVQLLLACIENLDSESDKIVRKRKLGIICRIIRAFGSPAISLANDLEFGVALNSLLSNSTASLEPHERQIADELQYALVASKSS